MGKGNYNRSGAQIQDESYDNSKYSNQRGENDTRVDDPEFSRRPKNVGAEDRQAALDAAYLKKHGHPRESPQEFLARSRGSNIINTKQFTINSKPKQGEFTYGDKTVITYNNRYYNRNVRATPHPKVPRPRKEIPEPEEEPEFNPTKKTLKLTFLASNLPGREQLPSPLTRTSQSRAELEYVYLYTGKNTINRVIHSYRASDRDSSVSKLPVIKN